jgi:sugar transferase EpsL
VTFYRRIGKRLFDLAVAGPVAVATAPVLGLAALAVRAELGSPVFFTQQRPGLKGAPFHVVKLRTMSDARDGSGVLLPDEDRLTPLGATLRRLSLDELPQLWNVVRGDMSLVGPRPLLMRYLDRYSPEQARRHDVKPGITGLAQVNGRNALTWDEKFAYDVRYVDELSLLLDLRILAQTALKVVRRDGIQSAGHATMPEFMGNVRGNADDDRANNKSDVQAERAAKPSHTGETRKPSERA